MRKSVFDGHVFGRGSCPHAFTRPDLTPMEACPRRDADAYFASPIRQDRAFDLWRRRDAVALKRQNAF